MSRWAANAFASYSYLGAHVEQHELRYHHIRTAITNTKGTSISDSPEDIEAREKYGHWEMDTVVGKQGTKTILLVLTERQTRQEMVFKMASKSQECVVRTLDKLERKIGSKTFREIFLTITCDNGCENLDFEGIERSCLTAISRTRVYDAHPYSAWERGSNENANKLIRRFIPKGADIGEFSLGRIKMIKAIPHNSGSADASEDFSSDKPKTAGNTL